LAYTTQARDNLTGPLHFTPPQSVWVDPSPRPGYRGQVVVLMGRDTVSCSEDFAMATMGRKPAITRIGENTQGVFSEVLMRKLPNGWTFGLPNQIYKTAEGKSFDGVGVPPDVTVPVFPVEELKAGRDSGMEKAVEILRKQN
jgi:C-terminal processing protease CtpA/Prc